MYNSEYMDPDKDADSLQRKVQFDIRFYFARRGAENMQKMKKSDFIMQFDNKTESWYIEKDRDELTKNHKDLDHKTSGIMPDNKDDKLCPVRSFRMYIDKLNPNNEYLWQRAYDKFDANRQHWYGLQHIGRNTLGKFMNDVSEKCKLSKGYTNHSVRVTGLTVLTRMQFSASEIMAVSGHKSVQSLTNYQRTNSRQKINMGNVLYQSMTRPEEQMIRPELQQQEEIRAIHYQPSPKGPATPLAIAPRAVQNVVTERENINPEQAVVPFEAEFNEDIPDFDLISMINELEGNSNKQPAPNAENNSNINAITTTTSVVNHVPRSMFSNCNIHNITFNIQK